MRYKHLFFASLTVYLSFTACQQNVENPQVALAKVNEKILYSDEIKSIVPEGVSGADSQMVVKRFIELWVKKQLLLAEAEKKSSINVDEINQKANAFRESLIMYEFQKQVLQNKMDTTVSDSAIRVFYNQHAKDFELKQNIVKGYYVKIKPRSPGFERLNREWQKAATAPLFAANIEQLCMQFSEDYKVELESWVSFETLVRNTPFAKIANKTDWLTKNKKFKIEEGGKIHLLYITDFKLENGISPLEYVKEQIKSIILNAKKIHIIEEFENDLYKNALGEKRVEIFENE